jgi:transposase-like protein
MITARAFRGCRFPAEIILWAVRWYLQFPVSYRDLERMLADRGVAVDHVSLFRWVQRFAPELEKRLRRHLRPCRGPWHVDATFVRVDGQWRYLYRAVDGTGQTIDFRLSARRDKAAARRFFRRALGRETTRHPREIVTDRLTSYPGCKGRTESPQKCRGKIPRVAVRAVGPDQRLTAPFLGGRPRRFGGGGGAMAAWARACSGMRSAWARSR